MKGLLNDTTRADIQNALDQGQLKHFQVNTKKLEGQQRALQEKARKQFQE